MYVIKNDIRKVKLQLVNKDDIHISVDKNYVTQIFDGNVTRVYQPLPTLKLLHETIAKYTVVNVMGAYGSGKSTGLNFQILFNAINMPPCLDGVRRCKVAVIRNTYDELKQTTYEMWDSWFSELGEVRATLKPLEYHHTFYDDKGRIELDIQFLALDKKQQYRKLRSSFFTFAYINEVSESPEGIISQVLGRTGRYPSMDLIDTSKVTTWYEREIMIDDKWQLTKVPYWSGVICDTNPPESESELFNIFEVQKPRGYALFKQPPGLLKTPNGWSVNMAAENIERLGLDYYVKQTYNATEEFIRVFCCGEYGSIKAGKLIYENYNDNIHIAESLDVLKEAGLRLSFDTWYNPACNISQYAMQQLRVLAAFTEEHMTLSTFVNEVVKPYIAQNFPGIKIESVVFDPAGMAGENVKGATSDFKILKDAFGDVVKPAITNKIKTRINAVDHFFGKLNRGQPAIIFDKQRCNILRQGCLKHYVWRKNKSTDEIIYEPLKNKYSHNQDALQYECLMIAQRIEQFSNKSKTYLKPPLNAPYVSYYA